MFNQVLYPKDRNIYHVTNEKEKSDMLNKEERTFIKITLTVSCYFNPLLIIEHCE